MRRTGCETGGLYRPSFGVTATPLAGRAPQCGTYAYYFGYWFYFFGFTRPSHARARGEGRR